MIRTLLQFIQDFPKITALLLGMLSAFAFPPFYLIFLLILSLCAVWALADRMPTRRQTLIVGYLYGFGFYSAGFYWVGNALLIDAQTFGWLYPITLFGSGAFFGLFMLLPFAVRRSISSPVLKIFGFASGWVAMEWFRSFFLTGFPWNLLGTIWAFDPIYIQTASLWGTYGLSLMTLIWIGAIYYFGIRRIRLAVLSLIVFPLFLTLFGWGRLFAHENTASDVHIRLVQPAIAQQMKWDQKFLEDNLSQYIALSRAQGEKTPNFVIWGETAVPFDINDYDEYRAWIASAVPENGYLLTGTLRHGEKNYFNSLYVLTREGRRVAFYDKSHLVPFGEYIPLRYYLPNWIRPIANNISDLGSGTPYTDLSVEGYPKFSALICYEIIFPNAVVQRSKKPQWLVLVSNDGWYGNSAGPYQHLVSAQMRAVEEGISIARSANTGISAMIDPFGRLLNSLPLGEAGYIDVSLPEVPSVPTLYAQGGDVLVIWLVLLLLGGCLYFGKRSNGLKNPLNTEALKIFIEDTVLAESVVSLEEITRGGNSFNYRVRTQKKDLLVKLIPEEKEANFERIVRILRFVTRYPDFYTAHEVLTVAESFKGFRVIVSDFIDGEKIRLSQFNSETLNRIMDNYDQFCRIPWETSDFILPHRCARELYESNCGKLAVWRETSLGRRRYFLNKLVEFNELFYRYANEPENGSQGTIHGDASLNNMLYTPDGRVAFLDLEMMRRGYPVEDAVQFLLSSLLLHAVFRIPLQRIKYFAKIINERGRWQSQMWQYAVCLYFLKMLHRRLNGRKLGSSWRKDVLFMLYLSKFEKIFELFSDL